MTMFEVLNENEIKFFHCLERIDPASSLWSVAIDNVVKNPDPVRYRMLVCELKSQANDSPEIMEKILGKPCFETLISL